MKVCTLWDGRVRYICNIRWWEGGCASCQVLGWCEGNTPLIFEPWQGWPSRRGRSSSLLQEWCPQWRSEYFSTLTLAMIPLFTMIPPHYSQWYLPTTHKNVSLLANNISPQLETVSPSLLLAIMSSSLLYLVVMSTASAMLPSPFPQLYFPSPIAIFSTWRLCRLMADWPQVQLAVSLHSPNDKVHTFVVMALILMLEVLLVSV